MSNPQWDVHAESLTFGWIQGPAITDNHIECDLLYTPHDPATPTITHYITACYDSKPVQWFEFCHDGGEWQCKGSGDGEAPVPEPASCALLALAAGGIGAMLRRRRRP